MSLFSLKHIRQKFQTKMVKLGRKVKNEQGQSFIEFLFLLLILMGLSIAMVTGFNGSVGERWKAIVNAIAIPNDTDNFEL